MLIIKILLYFRTFLLAENSSSESDESSTNSVLRFDETQSLNNTLSYKSILKQIEPLIPCISEKLTYQSESPIKLIAKKVSESEFADTIVEWLKQTYWINSPIFPPDENDVRNVLTLIFQDVDLFFEKVMLASTSLYVTDGYRHLGYSHHDVADMWHSRGIFQTSGKENYKLIAEITKDNRFINNPDILNDLSLKSASASLSFCKYLIKDYKNKKHPLLTFKRLLKILFCDEGNEENKIQFKKFISDGKLIYNQVRDLFINPFNHSISL